MATIQSPAISKPNNKFNCRVLRPSCYNVIYTPERWEDWTVLAEDEQGAMKVAQYHFFHSKDENIIISPLAAPNR